MIQRRRTLSTASARALVPPEEATKAFGSVPNLLSESSSPRELRVELRPLRAGYGMRLGNDAIVLGLNFEPDGQPGPAERAGVLVGHRIVQVQGTPVANKAAVVRLLTQLGGAVEFVLQDMAAPLAASPPQLPPLPATEAPSLPAGSAPPVPSLPAAPPPKPPRQNQPPPPPAGLAPALPAAQPLPDVGPGMLDPTLQAIEEKVRGPDDARTHARNALPHAAQQPHIMRTPQPRPGVLRLGR